MKHTSLFAVAVVTALFTLPTGASAQHTTQKEKAPMKNIVEIAAEAGSFNTLVAAVKAAGLVETLSGTGPFTVFAPTDAAFAKLPAGTVEALLGDKAKLTSILTFHVVAGKVMAADIIKANGATPTTVNGSGRSRRSRWQGVREWRTGGHGGHRGVEWRDPCDRYRAAAERRARGGWPLVEGVETIRTSRGQHDRRSCGSHPALPFRNCCARPPRAETCPTPAASIP